jgi:hypothetical protein
MSGGLGLGFGFSSSKSKSWIDPADKARQLANYQGAQGITPNYTPTSAGQIQGFMNPYTQEVVDASMGDAEKFRQMAVNNTADAANAAGAFGGSRHGVAEALTNQGALQQFGLLSAQLRSQGYGQALDAAQRENAMAYEYPLARQGLLNQTLAGVEAKRYGKQSGWGAQASFTYGGG